MTNQSIENPTENGTLKKRKDNYPKNNETKRKLTKKKTNKQTKYMYVSVVVINKLINNTKQIEIVTKSKIKL